MGFVASRQYTGAVLFSPAEIAGLKPLVARVQPRDILFDPEFFLASLSPGWEPRVVAVHHGREFAGVVYAKERIVCGVRLGIVYADLTLGTLLLGESFEQQRAFQTALEMLLAFPGIRGARLRVRRHSPELAAVRMILGDRRLDFYCSRVVDHVTLALPGTYEQLLMSFGGATRHNFRRYRCRFETAGHLALHDTSLGELRSAAHYLETKSRFPVRPGAIDRVLGMIAVADRPMAIGLRRRNGEWLSILGGVYRPAAAVLLLQLNNDMDHPDGSLSVVNRGYLIESLICEGLKELIIWAGASAPLSHYVDPIRTVGIHLDSPHYSWRLQRRLVSRFGPWLPRRFTQDARWVAPFS